MCKLCQHILLTFFHFGQFLHSLHYLQSFFLTWYIFYPESFSHSVALHFIYPSHSFWIPSVVCATCCVHFTSLGLLPHIPLGFISANFGVDNFGAKILRLEPKLALIENRDIPLLCIWKYWLLACPVILFDGTCFNVKHTAIDWISWVIVPVSEKFWETGISRINKMKKVE